ncbi:cell filamentation protein Fic [Kytococcus schroeteri]|uniref:Cell filamentation protein Fic n=1 Tax=Kytococcus schroeteri TaxID=138300 RepID=A0A2I1P8E6_9MICO|nr:cell filamentation protein Fic [Kytococcus schroeteri]
MASDHGPLAPGQWPAVTHEEHPWDLHPVTGLSRQDTWRVGRPYRAAVPPRIATLDLRVSPAAAALAEEAAAAVSAFDAEHGGAVAPYAAILLRSESASSSEIEHLSASARKVAEAQVNGSGTEHAVMIVGNVAAMEAALRLSDRLDPEAVLAMHRELMRTSDPDIAGRYRDDQVWIGGSARLGAGSPHDADFVPPVADRVPGLVTDVMAFAARVDLPAVAQAAVAHAQFETIHPFSDGNGRTGRALLQAMLRAHRLTRSASVPLSSGLLSDPNRYFDALTAYREGEVDPIVECVARASLVGVQNGRALVADLQAVRALWAELLTGLRADAGARRLADKLFQQPVVSAPMARELLQISANEHRHLDALVERGILKTSQDHKTRNRTWRADHVLKALDDYAARAGRRRRG